MAYLAVDDARTLASIPDHQISHIFTDPPYNLQRDYGPMINDNKTPKAYRQFVRDTAHSLTRISTRSCLLGLAVDQETRELPLSQIWTDSFTKAGWTLVGTVPLHPSDRHLYAPEGRSPKQHYYGLSKVILCFTRDGHRPAWLTSIPHDGWHIPRCGNTWHPAPFHPKLVEHWLSLTKPSPETTIFDPFSGSGTTVIVAQQLGFPAIGTDLNPEFIRLSSIRHALTPHFTHRPHVTLPGPQWSADEIKTLPLLLTAPMLAPWFGKKPQNGSGFMNQVETLPGMFWSRGGRYFQRDRVIPYLLDHGLVPHDPPAPTPFDSTAYYTLQEILRRLGRKETGHSRRNLILLCPGHCKINGRLYWEKAVAEPWILARLNAPRRPSRKKPDFVPLSTIAA